MKKIKLLTALITVYFSAAVLAQETPFTIYHTNDLHSHLDGVKVPSGKSYEKRGGFSRLATLIQTIKKDKLQEITIGVDAGDFFAGTIFSAMAVSKYPDFPEYQFFLENKYDLLTMGNHEFDAHNDGLEIMLQKADTFPQKIPLVASNLYVKHDSPLRKFLGEDKLIRPYLVKEFTSPKGNLKVGFLGILGPDGCLVSRSTRGDVHFIGFNDQNSDTQLNELVAHLNTMIHELRQRKKVNIVILSMHGGGKESYALAERLRGVDVLIAGHTHRQEFAVVNGVVINQTGSYGENLGFLELSFNQKTKKIKLKNPENSHVITVTDKVKENADWKERIDQWRTKSFAIMGHEKINPNEIIFTPKKTYLRSSKIHNPMGRLLTHAMISELNANSEEDPIDAYFTSMGLVRTSFYQNTPYSRAEIFEAVSIGFDAQKRPGIEVVSFYLSPKEVKMIINFMEAYTFISTSFSPAISPNLSFKVRKWGIPFINRIYDIELNSKPLSDYERPIKIATNKYVLANIETVKKITRGWIDLRPKTKTGEAMVNYPLHPKEYQLLIEHFRKNPDRY